MEIIKEYADEYTPDVLTEKENDYISEFSPTSSKFYCLPKIHKNKEIEKIMEERSADHLKIPEAPNIPRRPIVGGPSCQHTQKTNCRGPQLPHKQAQQPHGFHTKTTCFQSKKLCKGLFPLLGDASSECGL